MRDILRLITPKSVKKCRKYKQKFMHSFKQNMTVTEPIFIKLTLAIQTCVNNYNTELHENPPKSGVSDTRSEAKRQTDAAST